MTKYAYILIMISLISCHTESGKEVNLVKTNSISVLSKIELTESHSKPQYPFIDELNKQGFGTDTNRLKELAEYAYWDLRKSAFKLDDNVLVNQLDIKNSRVLEFRKFDNKDSLFTNSIKNGKGFYFVKVDSNGKAQKNSFDFGMEIWDYQKTDTAAMFQSWKEIYHPMPLYIELIDNQLYIFYTRRSVDYEYLINLKNKIIKAPKKV